MATSILLSERDLATLRLLEMTPATAGLLLRASVTFPEGPFKDDRRVRERMQTLADSGLVRAFPAAVSGGGLLQYYRLGPDGFRAIHLEAEQQPARTLLTEIAPSRFMHTMATADVIVHILVACHVSRIRIAQYHGDGKLVLVIGEYRQQPDCHFQFEQSGMIFNVLFEIDNATEPLESARENSIRTKVLGYEAYQDRMLSKWNRSGRPGSEPRFRVVFLTKSMARAHNMLHLARRCASNADRRLCLVGTQESFLTEANPLTSPILLDHHGGWQSLVDLFPTSKFLRDPVRLESQLAQR